MCPGLGRCLPLKGRYSLTFAMPAAWGNGLNGSQPLGRIDTSETVTRSEEHLGRVEQDGSFPHRPLCWAPQGQRTRAKGRGFVAASLKPEAAMNFALPSCTMSRASFSTQGPASPRSGLGHQFIVLQFIGSHLGG